MNNYKNFIAESKGISNTVIDYTNTLMNIYKSNKLCKKTVDLKNRDLPLYSLSVIFEQDLIWKGCSNYENSKLLDNKLYYVTIHIFVKDEENLTEIRNILVHELAHILVYYNILKATRKPKNQILDIVNKYKNKYDFIYFFNLVYLSTDDEINANIHNVYTHILKITAKDKNIIREHLEEHDVYLYSLNMMNFNTEHFLKNNMNILAIAKIINNFNSELEKNKIYIIKNKINDINEIEAKNQLIEYFNYWKKIFNKQGTKLYNRLNRLIDKIYDDKGVVNLYENNCKIEYSELFEKFKIEYKLKRLKDRRLNKLKSIIKN